MPSPYVTRQPRQQERRFEPIVIPKRVLADTRAWLPFAERDLSREVEEEFREAARIR